VASRSKKRRKRSRHRQQADPASTAPAQRPRRRREAAERPQPPWGSFPLSELAIFVGAVLLLLGFLSGSGPRQATMLVAGFAIASLGALEVTIREHVAGYRSHTLLLAGVPAVIVLGLLFYLAPETLPPVARVLIAAAVFALAAWGLTAIFRARSGGRAFRVKAPRR
jgi:hypothetical protein